MADPGTSANDVRAANDAFYKALSADSIEDISAAYAHDTGVTVLHEDSKEVAVGWQAVLSLPGKLFRSMPFPSFR